MHGYFIDILQDSIFNYCHIPHTSIWFRLGSSPIIIILIVPLTAVLRRIPLIRLFVPSMALSVLQFVPFRAVEQHEIPV